MNLPAIVTSRRKSIAEAGRVGCKNASHFVADSTEAFKDFLIAAGGFGRVEERPVMTIHLAGENRTGLIHIAADSDDGVNRLADKILLDALNDDRKYQRPLPP